MRTPLGYILLFSGRLTRLSRPTGRFESQDPRTKNQDPGGLFAIILRYTIPLRYIALRMTLGIVAVAGHAKAQYNSDFMNYSQAGRSIFANSTLEAGSEGLSNRFADKLALGGYIDDALKKKSAGHLKAKNNAGVSLNSGITAFLKGNQKWDLMIGIRDQEILNATYTKDEFNLAFYGNQMYQGKTADLSSSSVNALRFQEIKLGVVFHDSVRKFGVALSLLKGEQLVAFKTGNQSSLYTSADGSEILFNSNFNVSRSNPAKTGFSSVNGLGTSADLYYETTYENSLGKKSVFMVNANNLGFLRWQKSSVQNSSDSTFRYTGYNIHNLNDLKDSTLKKINSDSLLHKLAHTRKRAFNTALPANLVVINKFFFSNRFSLSLGLRYVFAANYRPYIFLEPEFRRKKFIFGLHTGYGGYARLNVGASVTLHIKDWFLKLGSNSLQGYVIPNSAFSQGVFCSIAKKLK